MPKAALGQPGPGWTFTVVETGQDGFSGDQARGFQTTPQEFQFGVCAVASTDPHCTFDPNAVPKVIDVLTPPGVVQSDELDYLVALAGRHHRRHHQLNHRPLIIEQVFVTVGG